MRITSIAAVMIAVSGLWLATLLKVFDNASGANAAPPDTISFSPLRNDICGGGSGDVLPSIGIEWKQMLGAAPSAECGWRQTPDRFDDNE
jgi:hypothetical protein